MSGSAIYSDADSDKHQQRMKSVNRFCTIGAGGFSVLLASLPGPGHACGASPSDGCPQLMTQSLTQQFFQQRADRGAAAAPDGRLDARLNDQAWSAGANGAAPFTATPGENAAEFGMSLSQFGSWMTHNDAEKIKAAKELLARGQKLPVPAKLDRSMDMWTRTRIVTDNPAAHMTGEALTSFVGADYKPVDGLLLGGLVQLDSADAVSAPLSGVADGRGYMAGPYVAMQLSPHMVFDARAAWGEAHDSIASGSAATSFQTTRSSTSARLQGDWTLNDWHLAPTAKIESINESATLGIGDAAANVGYNRMSVGPKISRQFDVGNDKTIEPFLLMNSSVDLNSTGGEALNALEPQNTIGAGFALSQTDDYTFSATANVENPGEEEDKNLRTGVKLTIPLD